MENLKEKLISRRAALVGLAAGATAALPGCDPSGALKLLISLPWDKITTCVVNLLTGTLAVIGFVNGKQVQSNVPLTPEQVEQLRKGAKVQADLNGGKSETLTPQVK